MGLMRNHSRRYLPFATAIRSGASIASMVRVHLVDFPRFASVAEKTHESPARKLGASAAGCAPASWPAVQSSVATKKVKTRTCIGASQYANHFNLMRAIGLARRFGPTVEGRLAVHFAKGRFMAASSPLWKRTQSPLLSTLQSFDEGESAFHFDEPCA